MIIDNTCTGPLSVELNRKPHGPVDDHMVEPPRRNDLAPVCTDGADIARGVLEHETQRPRFDDQATPHAVGDRVSGA